MNDNFFFQVEKLPKYVMVNIYYTGSELALLAHSLYILCILVCVNGLEEEEGGFDYIVI